MLIKAFIFSGLAIQSYVVVDEITKKCAVIDPPRIADPIIDYIRAEGLTIEAILETHVHADFVSGALELKDAFQGTPKIYCSAEGGNEWLPSYADKGIKDSEAIAVGSLVFKAMHTPGHTPEHLTWLCYDTSESEVDPQFAFTGDFLFVQGVGRPDLLGEKMKKLLLQELYTSLFTRTAGLHDDLHVLPSHGAGSMCGKAIGGRPSSTFGDERKTNPAFQKLPLAEWMAEIQNEMPVPPKTFARNKKINLTGAPLLRTLPPERVISSLDDAGPLLNLGWILDFRSPQAFGKEHVKGAVNIPTAPAVGNWLAGILPADIPLLCILSEEGEKAKVRELIRLLGYDQPLTFLVWKPGMAADKTSTLEGVTPSQLQHQLEAPNDLYIVDVRTPTEWNQGHLSSANHIELNDISTTETVPTNMQIVVICGSGWRSSIAASLLKKRGYKNVSHLEGGMHRWSSEM